MARWPRGANTVQALIDNRHLDKVSGASADGWSWITEAEATLTSAEAVLEVNPKSAYILAYDAARSALTSLLIQQGLRPTSKGGHHCVVEAITAQFGDGFAHFGYARRRRNELEYPQRPAELHVPADEARAAIDDTRAMIAAAKQLIDQLGFFS